VFTLAKIAKIVNGKLVGDGSLTINKYYTDSRKIRNTDDALFVAIDTNKQDGHNYLKSVFKQGVSAALVTREYDLPISQIVVDDSVKALQKLAASHRSLFSMPVVGITGSNGKTIVKEWVHHILSKSLQVCKSPKSYNSQIGVPLSVLALRSNHEVAVFEAGISKPDEMDALQEIINPTIGIFTHLGDAHGVNFMSQEQKVLEKLELFKNCGSIIYNRDEDLLHKHIKSTKGETISFGRHDNADLQLVKQEGIWLELKFNKQKYKVKIVSGDRASINNTLCTICTCIGLNLGIEEVLKQIPNLPNIDMRLQQVLGINGNQLILDYYNTDIDSLRIALDFVNQQKVNKELVIVLSDIEQNSLSDNKLYKKIDEILNSASVSRVITIGEKITKHIRGIQFKVDRFENTASFLKTYPFHSLRNSTILLKGARNFKFEQIADFLKVKNHRTVLEVNLSQIQRNFDHIKETIGRKTKIMTMVKALAYGSGGYQISKLLEFNKVDYLGVAYTDEAIELKENGITSPIVVLNPDLTDLTPYIDYNIQPVIYSFSSLNAVLGKKISVHLEIDTGMRRLGFTKDDVEDLKALLEEEKNIKVESVFSHLASADDVNQDDFTIKQISDFEAVCSQLEKAIDNPFIKHIANTAGIERFPNARLDMVRLGIGLYGVSTKKAVSKLQPVSTLKSHISQIKMVEANSGVGYGQHSVSDKERQIAIIAIGYADGFDRRFSQGMGGFVINGKYAPVVGNVCMDMTMCDVSDINCAEGDEAIVFGKEQSIEDLASKIGTIPYEVLTNVNERVNRLYFQE